MKTISKILLGFFYTILIAFIVATFSYFYQVAIQHKSYANILGYSLFTIQTGSMEPTLKVDDGIIVKVNSEYKENDIIVYQDNNMLVSHRVVNIEENQVTTKGDNNNIEDRTFDKSFVIGKVIKIIPNLR